QLPTPGTELCTGSLRPALKRLLDWADEYLHSGRKGFVYLSIRNRIAVSVATEVYAAIGEEIRRRNYDIHSGRAVVRWPKKLQKAVLGIFRASNFY
ncbi:MAG: squalene/phytoene synthase family protein, partial [Gemmataceae bacterium]